MSEPQSGAELLARIKPQLRRERVQLCLRPDLLDEWETACEELAEAQSRDGAGARLASGTPKATRLKAERVKDLEQQIAETAVWFEMQALPKDEWAALTEKHPPRDDNSVDLWVGYNRAAVEDAAVRPCMVNPVFDDASWADFVKVCNPGEWAALVEVVRSVNRAVTEPPKSGAAASVLTRLAATSKSPKRGA